MVRSKGNEHPEFEKYFKIEDNKLVFTVGAQSFTFDYQPDRDKIESLTWMRDMACTALANVVKEVTAPKPVNHSLEAAPLVVEPAKLPGL